MNFVDCPLHSITDLEYHLSCIYEKEKHRLLPPEYKAFSYDAHKAIMELLLTFDKNSSEIEDRFTKELKFLIKFIEFRGIKGQTLVNVIEIVSTEVILLFIDLKRYRIIQI